MAIQLDPALSELLGQVAPPKLENVDISELRAQTEASVVSLGAGAPDVHAMHDAVVPGEGAEVAVRIYHPRAEPGLPVLIFVHGGGWSVGSLAAIDPTIRRFCRGLDAVIVSVTYRLAPEHPFPAAFEDTLAATRWVLDNIGDHGGDPQRVAVGGDSAGANLVAAVTGALHDCGDDRLAAQLLLYPALDLNPDAHPTASWVADADPTLPTGTVRWCIETYLQGNTADDLRASPGRRPELSGLPPAVVAVAPADPFYDDASAYVDRLRVAGVAAELVACSGLTHGFANFVDLVPAAAAALEDTMNRFRRLLAGARA
jgi:acetyl esterase